MKSLLTALVAAVLVTASCSRERTNPDIHVYFSPKGGCTEAVVENLDKATNSIYVQAYSFTSAPIAKALVDAHRRGVKVQVILDSSQRTEKYSSADFVKDAGIPTYIDSKHAIAHNKIMIIDEGTILTGSFNFTKAAEQNNAENLLVIVDPPLAKEYLENWRAHLAHSDPYQSKMETGTEDQERRKASPKRENRFKRTTEGATWGLGADDSTVNRENGVRGGVGLGRWMGLESMRTQPEGVLL